MNYPSSQIFSLLSCPLPPPPTPGWDFCFQYTKRMGPILSLIFFLFETGLFCVALAVLELTL